MTFALIVTHTHVCARMAEIDVEWVLQNTDGRAWEVLVN